jgi:hypothetical protein
MQCIYFLLVEFAIIDVINSAIPNVVVNIPTAATRPLVNIPAVPSQGGAAAFASARGPAGSQILTQTSVRRRNDDDDKRK